MRFYCPLYQKQFFLFSVAFLMGLISLQAQRGKSHLFQNIDTPPLQDNSLITMQDDSVTILKLVEKMNEECGKHVYLNLDSVKYFAHAALTISKRIGDNRWIQFLHDGLGYAYYVSNQQDSARYYYELAYSKAVENCDLKRLYKYSFQLGVSFQNERKYDNAIAWYNEAIDYAIEMEDTSNVLAAKSKISNVYLNKGDYAQTVKISHEILREAILSKDTSNLLYNYGMLSALYGDMKLYENEMRMAKAAYSFVRLSKDTNAILTTYGALSNAYLNQNSYDSAIYYARLNSISSGHLNTLPYSWLTIADAFLGKNMIDSAEWYYHKTINEFNSTNRVDVNIYLGLGQCALKNGNKKLANLYFKKAESNIDKAAYWDRKYVYKALANFYDETNENELALQYFKKYKSNEDSLLFAQKALSIGITESEYENQLITERLLVAEKEKQIQTLLTQKQKKEKYYIYAGSSFIFIFMLISFIRHKKQKELEHTRSLTQERLRISRDLHDEVGATLSGIALYSHLAKKQTKNVSMHELNKTLDIIKESAGLMVSKLGDIVWLLNPDHDTFLQLIDKLEDSSKQMAALKNIVVKLTVSNEIRQIQLPVDVRRNIYLICKEAINNTIKYSNANRLEVCADIQNKQVNFLIADNGIGFTPKLVKKGNGLVNMEKRAAEIGATFQIQSSPFEGCRISLHYKLPQ